MSFPSPIGATFLLTLCMFAKSNQPDGTRNVVVHFLSRLVHEAELIMCEVTSSTHERFANDIIDNNDNKNNKNSNSNNEWSRKTLYTNQKIISLLMLSPASTIVPLLDVIRKIGYELHFSYHQQTVSTQLGEQFSENKRARERSLVQRSEMFTRHLVNMHIEFVKLLCALAERIEQIPLLANFFISEHSKANNSIYEHHLYHNTNSVHLDSDNYTTFELLDLLLPYLSYDHLSENGSDVRDMYRFAFGAILSLAKCSDEEVKKFVSNAENHMRTCVLTSMRTTLLTLCKVPHNDESVQQLCYLVDAIRWWSCYELILPHYCSKARTHELLNCFVQEALLPLFQSNNTHAYTAVCLITARLLHNLQEAQCCHVVEVIVKYVLYTLVREVDGKVVRNCNVCTDTNSFANRSSNNSENVENGKEVVDTVDIDASEKFVSFSEFYLFPHLTTKPTLTKDQYINSEAIGFHLDEWSATAATLILIKTIVDTTPFCFLQFLTTCKKDQTNAPNWTCSEQMCRHTPASSAITQEQKIEYKEESAECTNSERNEGECAHFSEISECFPPAITTLIEKTTTCTLFGIDREAVDEEILCEVLIKQEIKSSFSHICECENRKQVTPLRLSHSPSFSTTKTSATQTVEHLSKEQAMEKDETCPSWKSYHSSYCRNESWSGCKVVLMAPLLKYLYNMIKEFIYLPHNVRLLLCGVIRSICLLPSDKLFNSLFNSEHGYFFRALTALRIIIERALDEETSATLQKEENVQEERSNVCATNADCTCASKETERREVLLPTKAEAPTTKSKLKSTSHQMKFDNLVTNDKATSNSILNSASRIWSAFKSQEHTSSTSGKKRSVLENEVEPRRGAAKQIQHLTSTQRQQSTTSKLPKRKWKELWLEYLNLLNSEMWETNSINTRERCFALQKNVPEADYFTHNQDNKAISLNYYDLPELLKACVDVTLLAIDLHAIARFQHLSKLIQSL